MAIEEVIFDVADALEVPVLVLTLAALAYALFEFGSLVGELVKRRGRNRAMLESTVADVRARLMSGDPFGAATAAERISWSKPMSRALGAVIELVPQADAEARSNKVLADFDYACIKRLERTRILVRMGPALGLMGTLIPLSPALAGLASGDVEALTDNLRVAFSVTVCGLLIGAIAFAISLIRDRLYGQDFSDAEYLTNAVIGTPVPKQPAQPQPQHQVAPQAYAAPTTVTPGGVGSPATGATAPVAPAPQPRPAAPAPPTAPPAPPPGTPPPTNPGTTP